jgi:hypothetical protein
MRTIWLVSTLVLLLTVPCWGESATPTCPPEANLEIHEPHTETDARVFICRLQDGTLLWTHALCGRLIEKSGTFSLPCNYEIRLECDPVTLQWMWVCDAGYGFATWRIPATKRVQAP